MVDFVGQEIKPAMACAFAVYVYVCVWFCCAAFFCDVPLRRVRTPDLAFEASLAKEVWYLSSFRSAMASNRTVMNYSELIPRITTRASFVIERSNLLAVGGAKTSLCIKRTLSNRHVS